MRWIICLLIIFVVFANSYAAGIYKCTDDKGRTLFSQTPCGRTAESINVDPIQRNEANAAMLQERLQYYREGNAAGEKQAAQRRQDRKIRELEAKKDRLRRQRDQQITTFEDELSRAYGYNRTILRDAILGERQTYDLQAKDIDAEIDQIRIDRN